MCGNQTCPLEWRDKLNLRILCNELSEDGRIDLLQTLQPIALVIFDCCQTLHLDPVEVLGPKMVGRIERRGDTRLWPTLSEDEDAELAETDAIREGPTGRDTGMREGASFPDDYEAGTHRHWSKPT